jgi:YVTN family beta-propeller protein
MTKIRGKRYTLSILAVLVVAAIMAAFVVSDTFAQESPSCAVDNYVWVVNQNTNSISKINKATNTVEAIIPGAGFTGLAVDDESVWTANFLTPTVSKINKATNTIETTIDVGQEPLGVAVDDTYAWAINSKVGDSYAAGTVSKIDKATNLVVKTIDLNQSYPNCITVDDKYVWVGNHLSNSVSKIDKATDTVVQTIDLNPYTTPDYEGIKYGPWGITVDEDYVWVSNHRSYSISKIDKITGDVVAIDIRAGLTYAWPTGVAVDDKYLWAAITAPEGYPNALFKIDKASNAILETINGEGELYGPVIDKDYVWVIHKVSGTISKINKITNQIVATVSGLDGGPIINGDGTGYSYENFFPCIIAVIIDIKPLSFPNSINLQSKGEVPVAILSSPTFDATTVDRNTVVFDGTSPLPKNNSIEDVNGDGLLDLVLHFNTQDLNLQTGDTEACLSGKTLNGMGIKGCDSVRIVK